MGLIMTPGKFRYALLLTVFVWAAGANTAYPSTPPPETKTERQEKTLVVKTERDMSLEALVTRAGYSLDDENTPYFLRDFVTMNPAVKSLSVLKKGTAIRLPLKYLKRSGGQAEAPQAISVVRSARKTVIRKKEAGLAAGAGFDLDKVRILGNIKTLFESLGDSVTVEAEGLKVFSIGEKSELSLERSFFPSIILHNEHIIVFDYTGILPEELKNLLEISWPEFRIVSYRKGMDLKRLFAVLLNESGYVIRNGEKFIMGGRSRIEYNPDFLVFRRTDDVMESEISLISIIDTDESRTPDSLLNWLSARGIRIAEIAYHASAQPRNTAAATVLEKQTPPGEFAEGLLRRLGYDVERNRTIDLSHRKEFSFKIQADFSIKSGNRPKVIELSELSDDEMSYARKRGLDIFCIDPREDRTEIAGKLVSFLALKSSNHPLSTSALITPKNVRYRLYLPGVYAESRKGAFFLTDSELDTRLLEKIVRDKITILKL